MVLSAATVHLIEGRFSRAALWCLAGSALSAAGLVHAYAILPADTVGVLRPAWSHALGYAILAVLFLAARWITEPAPEGEHR